MWLQVASVTRNSRVASSISSLRWVVVVESLALDAMWAWQWSLGKRTICCGGFAGGTGFGVGWTNCLIVNRLSQCRYSICICSVEQIIEIGGSQYNILFMWWCCIDISVIWQLIAVSDGSLHPFLPTKFIVNSPTGPGNPEEMAIDNRIDQIIKSKHCPHFPCVFHPKTAQIKISK